MKVNGGEINLLGGITEQPVDRRAEGTVSSAVDMVIDPVHGLRRRNPWTVSRVFDTRPELGDANWYLDVELFDETYTVVVCSFTSTQSVRIYIITLEGDWSEVTADITTRNYLYTTNIQTNPYRITSFDNNIVIVNTIRKPFITSQGGLTNLRTDQKYCTLIGSNYNRTYTITVSSVSENYELTYSYTTPEVDDGALTPQEIADALQPATIVADLASQIEVDLGNSVFHAKSSGNVLEVYPDPDEYHTDMVIKLDDGDNLNNFSLVDRIITSTDDLPARARYGDYITVRTNDREKASEYYLVYVSKDDILNEVYPYNNGTELTSDGTWVETYENGLANTLRDMPITLTRDGNTWSNGTTLFTKRLVGNDENNKAPSFISEGNIDQVNENKKIIDCFYVQNRLALVTSGSVIFSQTNKQFNLWKDSAVVLLDSDRIDISAGVSEGGAFITASQINDDILILTDRSQYGINASSALTPRTAVIRLLTKYPCRADLGAASMGATAAFVVRNGEAVQIREIAPRAGVTGNYTSEVLTAQIPNKITGSIYDIITAPNDSMLLALTDSAVFAYYWYDVGGNRQIQAWTEWTPFDSYAHVTVKDSVLYGFVQTSDYGDLLRIDKMDIGLREVNIVGNQDVFSDQRHALYFNFGSSSSSENVTDRFSDSEINDLALGELVLVDEQGYPLNYTYNAILDKIVVDEPNQNVPYSQYYIGYDYTGTVQLSPTIPRDQEGNVMTEYKLILQDMTFRLSNSGIVKVDVSIQGVDTYDYVDSYESERIISMSGINDLSYIRTYKFEVPIRENSRDVTITVNSVGIDPLTLTGYDWSGQQRGSGQRRIY